MRTGRLPGNARLWAAIWSMFIVALFGAAPVALAGPSHSHPSHSHPSHSHPSHSHPSHSHSHDDHHISATGELDHLAAVDHSHIGPAAIQGAPDTFAESLLHRVRIALPVLGLIFVGGVLWLWSPRHTVAVGRDPPRGPLMFSTGRVVLTRLCIARR